MRLIGSIEWTGASGIQVELIPVVARWRLPSQVIEATYSDSLLWRNWSWQIIDDDSDGLICVRWVEANRSDCNLPYLITVAWNVQNFVKLIDVRMES